MGDSALVLTKIEAPRIRPGHVHRPDLVARLDEALDRRLTLVFAPAGWGKTSLLAEWLATKQDTTFAWLSLDEEDNDPAHFWAYVAAALRGAGIEIPREFEAAVEAPGTPASDAALVPTAGRAPLTLSNPGAARCEMHSSCHGAVPQTVLA